MKNIILFLLLFVNITLTICSCNTGFMYIISKEDSLEREQSKNKDGVVLLPPKIKYSPYTFVIDSSNNVYYYELKQEEGDFIHEEEEPSFIKLMADDITRLKEGDEKEFFMKKFANSKVYNSIMFASYKDTIDHKFFKYVEDFVMENENEFSLTVRLALPEERIVIRNKIKR